MILPAGKQLYVVGDMAPLKAGEKIEVVKDKKIQISGTIPKGTVFQGACAFELV